MFKIIIKLERASRNFFKKIWDYSESFLRKGCDFFERVRKATKLRSTKRNFEFVFGNEFRVSPELIKKIKNTKSITLDELLEMC